VEMGTRVAVTAHPPSKEMRKGMKSIT
jgi:hypothetical protein